MSAQRVLTIELLLADSRLQKNFIDCFSNASRFWLTKQLQLRNRWNQAEPPLFEDFAESKQLIKIAIANAGIRSEIDTWADHPALNNAPLNAAQTAVIQSYRQGIQDAISANPGIPIDFIAGDAKPYHKVSFWLRHWIACAASENPSDRLLVGFGKQKDLLLSAVDPDQARNDLNDLLAIYNHQLQDVCVALPIFINAMFAWRKDPNKRFAIEQALMGDDDDDGGGGSFKAFADMDDPYHALVWRDGAPAIDAMIPLWARIFKAMPLELAPLARRT